MFAQRATGIFHAQLTAAALPLVIAWFHNTPARSYCYWEYYTLRGRLMDIFTRSVVFPGTPLRQVVLDFIPQISTTVKSHVVSFLHCVFRSTL